MFTPFDTTKPKPDDYIKDVFRDIRDAKMGFAQRFALEHYIGESTDPADYNCDGYHKYLTLTPLNSIPERNGIFCIKDNTSIYPLCKRGEGVIIPFHPITIYGFHSETPWNVLFQLEANGVGDPIRRLRYNIIEPNIPYWARGTNDLVSNNIGLCWNLTGNPIYPEGLGEMFPFYKNIYMRVWNLYGSSYRKYSENQLVFQMQVDNSYDDNGWPTMYEYFPSKTEFFQPFPSGHPYELEDETFEYPGQISGAVIIDDGSPAGWYGGMMTIGARISPNKFFKFYNLNVTRQQYNDALTPSIGWHLNDFITIFIDRRIGGYFAPTRIRVKRVKFVIAEP